jgi:2-(1,2-epoxy-1,2-dihydrophenyl)acetyl-CoA isomerase
MTYTLISLDKADGLATLTFRQPQKLNAVSRKMIAEIKTAWEDIAADGSVRAVLVTGEGRGFCAGADIVAAVNGVAAGVGMSFAMASDITIAAKSASFLQAFARIGLLPDGGSTWFLPRLVGDARARALAMLAPQIKAEQAKEWGLIWDVVEDDELMPKATELARRLADGPTLSLARIKAAMNQASANDLSGQLDLERDFQRELGRSEDFREGVQAFLAKRKANFKGK